MHAGAISSVSEKYDPHGDDADRGMQDFFHGSVHSYEHGSSKNGSLLVKEKKKEMLVNGIRGKRSERERNKSRDQGRHISISRDLSLDCSQNEGKPKTKPKQKSSLSGHPDTIVGNAGHNDGKACEPLSGNQDTLKEKQRTDLDNLQLHELDSMDELGASGDLSSFQDLGSLFNFDDDVLLEDDSIIGLEIPPDDLADLNLHF